MVKDFPEDGKLHQGRIKELLEGRGEFSKNIENFVDLFLGRPNWFSQIFRKTR